MLARKPAGTTAALAAITLAVALAWAGAAAAAPGPDNRPVRFWSFSEHHGRAGDVQVAGDAEVGGALDERFDFGPAGFDFPESKPRNGIARGRILSTASGRRYAVLAQAPSASPPQTGAPNGGTSHLDQFQAYRADGALDESFGVVKTDLGGGDDFAEGVTVDASGRIVVVGRATTSTILDMAVVRYRADGALDTGFGDGGKLTADFRGKGEFGQDVAIQADGKIVAAGYTANGFGTEFALMRIDP
jgi:uncharacterized delta-60 repeat protein